MYSLIIIINKFTISCCCFAVQRYVVMTSPRCLVAGWVTVNLFPNYVKIDNVSVIKMIF